MLSSQDLDRLKTGIAEILDIGISEINQDSALGETTTWDSLNHIKIVKYVEDEFKIAVTADDVVKMTHFQGICDVISQSSMSGKATGNELDKEDFVGAFRELGLESGDSVFVHSSIGVFGSMKDPLSTILNSFLTVIGSEGTLAVPTFNFGFMKKEPFDVTSTPSKMGALSEYVRKDPRVLRSMHPPFHSISAMGKEAKRLSGVRAKSSFSRGSVFGLMYDMDFKVCMLGTSLTHNTFYHYVEEQIGVPYRFYKKFSSTLSENGKTSYLVSYRYYARYLKPVVKHRFHELGERHLEDFGGKKLILGKGPIYLFPCRKFTDIMMGFIRKDPLYLISDKDRGKIQRPL